jgi:hypothetical protein
MIKLDLTRVLEKIVPESDGPSPLYRRKATVLAVNGDGTVDINLSGVLVPSVDMLGGAQVTVGANVQVLVERGALLVLGKIGAGVSPPTVWPNTYIEFGTPTIVNNTTTSLTPSAVPYDPNPTWPGSGSTFTVPSGQGGLYSYGAHLRFPVQASAVGYRQIRVVVNGVERSIFQEVTAGTTSNGLSIPVNGGSRAQLAAGATIVFRAHQTSGVDTTLIGTGNVAWIQRVA